MLSNHLRYFRTYRLTVSHLKCRDIVANAGIRIPPEVKSELTANGALAAAAEEDDDGGGFSVVDALDGFSLVLSQEGDVIHVSNNVTTFIGLSAFELLGNPFSEFVHPCDHEKLRQLHPQDAQQDAHIEVRSFGLVWVSLLSCVWYWIRIPAFWNANCSGSFENGGLIPVPGSLRLNPLSNR